MLRDKEIDNISKLALSEDEGSLSRTEELFENQSLHEMPQVSEATTERDSDEEDIVTNDNEISD